MMVDDFANQQKQSDTGVEAAKNIQQGLNFTNLNGIQYISVVDERNRRGRPPKQQASTKQADMIKDEPIS